MSYTALKQLAVFLPPPVLRGRVGVGVQPSRTTPTLTLPRSTGGGDKSGSHPELAATSRAGNIRPDRRVLRMEFIAWRAPIFWHSTSGRKAAGPSSAHSRAAGSN